MTGPGKYALDIYRGDSKHWVVKLWSDTAKTVPVDLLGVVVKSEIRVKPAGALLASISCIVTTPNIIDLELAPAESHKLVAQGGTWDLQLTYPSGDVHTVLAGPVRVTVDVTDSGTL